MSPVLPEIASEEAYLAVYKNVELWHPAAREICRRHGLAAATLERTATGTNIVYRVAPQRIIKLFSPLWPNDILRERTALAAVTGTGLATPELVDEDELEGWPYVIMTEIEGVPISAVWPELDAGQQLSLTRDMGGVMRKLHALPAERVAAIALDWSLFLEDQMARFEKHHTRFGAPPELVSAGLALLERIPIRATAAEAETFIHADLTFDHFLVSERSGSWQLSGLIDFADAMVGHRYYEFIAPTTFLLQRRPELQRALLLEYGFTEAELTRELAELLTGYCFLHRYGHMLQMVKLSPGKAPESFDELCRSLWGFA